MQLLSLVMSVVMAVAAPVGDAPAPSTVRDLHRALSGPDRRVRTAHPRITAALFEGVRRSRTFAGLVAELERSDVIAYVELAAHLPPLTEGRLMLVSKGGGTRYLRIQIRSTLPHDQMISLIGHELQHAVEIAGAPGVRDETTLKRFYERIGVGRTDVHGFDTDAARVAGDRVRGELRRAS